MHTLLIQNGLIINEGHQFKADILIQDDLIQEIGQIQVNTLPPGTQILNVEGKIVIPGVIDDQVHFREPGLSHKGDLYTESKAAVAGGVTSFMEMPNTNPQTITLERLEEKFILGSQKSFANYSFYLGATNDNLEEIKKLNPKEVCGVKVFMGSSTGNMLVDKAESLDQIFKHSPVLIATHCEDETTIQQNLHHYKEELHGNAPFSIHPFIRSAEACYLSSKLAIDLAKKHGARLHILHLSTADELSLLDPTPLTSEKRITAEVCVHHLWFTEEDYNTYGWKIKWNPSIKSRKDREALRDGLLTNRLDVIATDHAPHTLEEKDREYFSSASGGPLVQHSLVAMLEFYHHGIYSLEFIVHKMSHAVATAFNIAERGFLRKGYKADIAIVDLHAPWKVSAENLLYKCGWSPFEGTSFQSKVLYTIINGKVVYSDGEINEDFRGERLKFDR